MTLSLIVAMDQQGGIGQSGRLPWHLPDDLRYFKQVTQDATLLMGRKTWESLPGLLPGRPHWVLSRSMPQTEGIKVFSNWNDMRQNLGHQQAFVIGGSALYRLALEQVETLFVTHVHGTFDCDVFFPDIVWDDWELIHQEEHEADERHRVGFTFARYQKKSSGR